MPLTGHFHSSFHKGRGRPICYQTLRHVVRALAPAIMVLTFATVAHAQGTMDFSGAQTLMGTFKTQTMCEQTIYGKQAGVIKGNEARQIPRWNRRTHIRTFNGALFGDQTNRRYAQPLIRGGQSNAHGSAAATGHRVRLCEDSFVPDRFDCVVNSASCDLA